MTTTADDLAQLNGERLQVTEKLADCLYRARRYVEDYPRTFSIGEYGTTITERFVGEIKDVLAEYDALRSKLKTGSEG